MRNVPIRLLAATDAASRALTQYRAALHERNVALLISAGVISEIGDWFNTVALVSLSYQFGDGALAVGGMIAAKMATRLVFQAPAGAIVDRYAGRRLFFVTQIAMAAIAVAFALLVIVPELWLLYALAVGLEVVNCLARPSFMVELKVEAPEAQRAAANGTLFAGQTTAQLVGPLIGALALTVLGPGAVFALNGLTFLGVAFAVTRLRGRPAAMLPPASDSDRSAQQPSDQPVSGYRWLLRRRDLGAYAFVCLSLSLLVQATVTLFIVSARAFGLDDGAVGLFFTAVGAGSIAGSVVAGGRHGSVTSLYPAALAMAICAVAIVGFGLANSIAVAVVALVIAGFATDYYEVVGLTYFQQSLPDNVFARFYSIFILALSAGGLIGAFAGPLVLEFTGLSTTLIALAVPGFALAVLLAVLTRDRQTMSATP